MKKILIVEDHFEIVEMIKMVLQVKNYNLVHTADGAAAVPLVRKEKPDLILLDVMLPGMDGYTIQSHLLADETTKNIPIIVMTSKSQMEDVFKTATNVHGFIEKPFVIKEFIDKIEEVLKE